MNWRNKVRQFLGLAVKVESKKEVFLNSPEMIDLFNSKQEISEAIYSVINRLSNTFASLPLKMIDDEYKQPTDCKAYNILNDGPRYFTKFDFFRDIEAMKNYQGNAYVQLFRDVNGAIIDMALIKSDCCEPVFDVDSGELYYQITATDNKQYQEVMYMHYMEVLHFKHTRVNNVKGMNPLDILADTVGYDTEVRKISLNQLNGTNEGLKVRLEANVDEETKKAIAKNVASFYKENGGLLFEEHGVTIERMQRDLVDSKLLDTEKMSRSRIAMVYNVPEHFVGNTQSSYSSQEQLNMEFLTYNLVPNVTQYEMELNKKVLTKAEKTKGYRFKFNVASLLRADTATRGNFYQVMRRNSAYSANDVRRYEDLPPSPLSQMNEYHISGDLYPIDMDPVLRKSNGKGSDVADS